MKRKKKKIILLLCLTFVLIIGTSAFISATNTIENEILIVFNDKNLYEAVKNHFLDKSNNIKHNANEELLTIRSLTRGYKFSKRTKFSWGRRAKNKRYYRFGSIYKLKET